MDDRVRRSTHLAIFLDYDGTIAEIVDDPSKAFLPDATRDVIRLLSSLCTVLILSGRDAQHLRKLVDLEGIVYAGSHGFDILMADGKRIDNPRWKRFLPILDDAEKEFRSVMRGIPGVIVERKRFAISVHYRMVDSARVKEVKRKFASVASSYSRKLRASKGKKVLEVLPDVDWDKGMALLFLQRTLKLTRRGRTLTIFIGDDVTDEDGFKVIRDGGVGILVANKAKKDTFARYSLPDPAAVRLFLEKLAHVLEAMPHD